MGGRVREKATGRAHRTKPRPHRRFNLSQNRRLASWNFLVRYQQGRLSHGPCPPHRMKTPWPFLPPKKCSGLSGSPVCSLVTSSLASPPSTKPSHTAQHLGPAAGRGAAPSAVTDGGRPDPQVRPLDPCSTGRDGWEKGDCLGRGRRNDNGLEGRTSTPHSSEAGQREGECPCGFLERTLLVCRWPFPCPHVTEGGTQGREKREPGECPQRETLVSLLL